MNLTELLDLTACRWPQKPALIEGSTVVSYAALLEKVAAAGAQLKALGLGAGSRVGLCHPNNIDYIVLTFALWRLKAVVVPIPIECMECEFSAIAETMQLEALLSQQAQGQSVPMPPGGFFTRL